MSKLDDWGHGAATYFRDFTSAASDVPLVQGRGAVEVYPHAITFTSVGTYVLERLDGTLVNVPVAAADLTLDIRAKAIDSTTTNGLGLVGHYKSFLGSAWRPSDLTGLTVWLRADMGITLNGSNVSAWADQSGNDNDATQSTASSQPLYSATGFNGQPCLDATSDYMTFDTMTSAGNDLTSFVAVNPDSISGSATQMAFSSGTTGVPLVAERNGAYAIYDGAYKTLGTPTAVAQIFATRLDAGGTTCEIYVDGASIGSVAYDGTLAWLTPALFALSTGTAPLDGLIAELVVYNRVLTDGEVTQVHEYMTARYGL